MRNTIIFLWVALLFTACTEKLETDYKGKSDNLLVVIGELSTDTTAHIIKLSRTVDFNSLEENLESGAKVAITDLTNGSIMSLTERSDGIYVTDSNAFGIQDHSYRLDIETTDGVSYYAESKIEGLTEIDSVEVKFELDPFSEKYRYNVNFSAQEPADQKNYYIWNVYLNDTLYNDTLNDIAYSSDEMVNGSYIRGMTLYSLTPDEVKSDTTIYTVEMESITEAYYNYLSEVGAETQRGSPFDSTPANVSTNIKGGEAVGFFKTCMRYRESVVHIKDEDEKKKAN